MGTRRLMRTRLSVDLIHIDLSLAEARVFLDELTHVRGGARLPKIRQVCKDLEVTLMLVTPKVGKISSAKT